MTRTRSLALLAVTCGILLAGCDPANTAPTAPPAAPRPNFVNGPAQAGIVVRFTTTDAGIFVVDRASGLVVVEGIPPDPTTLALACPPPNDPLTWLEVERHPDVLKAVIVGRDVNLAVFRLSDFDAFGGNIPAMVCAGTTPLAVGTGRAALIDNDFFGTSGKNEAYTIRLDGTVTDLSTGALLRVTAFVHAVLDYRTTPPTERVNNTYVRLDPVHGP